MTAPTPVQQADRPEGWWAYPPVYAVGVYLLAYLPNLAWWAGLPIGVVLACLGKVLARHTFHSHTHGELFSWWAQLLGMFSGLAAGVWLTVSRLQGGPLATWQWLAWGAAGLGLAHLVLLWLAPKFELAQTEKPTGVTTMAADDALQVFYQGILSRAGSEDVRVTDVVISPSGGVESVHLTPTLVDMSLPKAKRNSVNRDQFDGRLGHIVVELDQTLRRRPQPVRVDDQDVHVERGRGSSEWIMHVTVARPLEVTSRFEPADSPQPWCGAKKVGRYEDDAHLFITFCDEQEGAAHSEAIIKTGGGKTASLNVMIARHLEAGFEGRVWVVGTNKCLKLARPWLDPWLRGLTGRPVIDWVAGEEIWPVLRALASAYEYAVACNRKTKGNSARKPRTGAGALAVFMDEASDTLMRKEAITCCDGVKRNASELCDKIQQVGRTGPVGLHKFNQNALFDSFGSNGSQQRRNIGIGIAGQCKAAQDAQRVIPGLPRANPMQLRRQAVFVEQAYEEPRELRARFDFIEDDDIPGLAMRYTPWQGGLDPQITAHMPFYADRWAPQWHPALIREIEAEGLAWPGSEPHTGAQDEQLDDTREESAVAGANNAYRDPTELDMGVWDLFDQPVAETGDLNRSTFEKPDPSQMVAGFRRMAEWVRAQEAKSRDTGIPDPLGRVSALLRLPKAPTEWVATEILALALQRVAPDADADAIERASAQLGRDLTAQDPALAAAKSQKSFGSEAGRRVRKWGYDVPALLAAAERLRER